MLTVYTTVGKMTGSKYWFSILLHFSIMLFAKLGIYLKIKGVIRYTYLRQVYSNSANARCIQTKAVYILNTNQLKSHLTGFI